jgi:hypothetical protein
MQVPEEEPLLAHLNASASARTLRLEDIETCIEEETLE